MDRNIQMDVASFPAGIYFVRMIGEKSQNSVRVLISR
jgi:hypothetical protein